MSRLKNSLDKSELWAGSSDRLPTKDVTPTKGGVQTRPCENREPVFKDYGFPASSAGHALLPPTGPEALMGRRQE